MDIFKGWDDYVERLQNNWHAQVTENDTVVIPGDISWALKLCDTEKDLRFLDELPGRKLLLKGNHDLWWCTMKKMRAFLEERQFKTLDFVFNSAVVAESYSICGSRGWFFDDKEQSQKVILREAQRLRTSLQCAAETGLPPLVFMHYPAAYNGQHCEEMIEVLKEFNIKDVWHGHIHGAGKQYAVSEFDGISFHLISCDCINFSPQRIK